MFTGNTVNLVTKRKARSYMGQLPQRDYAYLDVSICVVIWIVFHAEY